MGQYSKMGGCAALLRGLAYYLVSEGLRVVSFDMRGVGKSSGHHTWTGCAEVKDVEAVCKWVHSTTKSDVLLVGNSAGAPISGSAIEGLPFVCGYVGIGYLFGWWSSWLFGEHIPVIKRANVPKLFIMGDRDGFTSAKQLHEHAAACKGHTTVHLVEGVGHFELESSDHDESLARTIVSWFRHHVLDLERSSSA
eukprot:TRINITY_DN4215_c0_g1_i1.p1 TRINITY_DN4215_c0_g1~~TRINITY_DN4215_c0_g1_i1.p1  ORF type:complete len:213 (-),score=16.15 TRINITY_DN4215_c0_g1_i1:411-992(-)